MAAVFAFMLPALYARLGDSALFSHAGAAPVAVRVMFDKGGGGGLDGMLLMADPMIRMQVADAPQGVSRGDLFQLQPSGQMWKAREGGVPMLDGAELRVPLAQV